MTRVFAVEPCKHDLTTAAVHGEIKYVYPSQRASMWSGFFRHDVAARFDEMSFDPAQDLFIIAGNINVVSIVISILAQKYGRFKALAFDAVSQDYRIITLGC